MIDNGNHLLLSGNCDARAFLAAIGPRINWRGQRKRILLLRSCNQEAMALRPNDGPLPWWIFSGSRRVPDTRPRDYLHLLRLLVLARTPR